MTAKNGGKYCNGNVVAVPGEEGNLGVIGAIPEIYKWGETLQLILHCCAQTVS